MCAFVSVCVCARVCSLRCGWGLGTHGSTSNAASLLGRTAYGVLGLRLQPSIGRG